MRRLTAAQIQASRNPGLYVPPRAADPRGQTTCRLLGSAHHAVFAMRRREPPACHVPCSAGGTGTVVPVLNPKNFFHRRRRTGVYAVEAFSAVGVPRYLDTALYS